jgi:hypothetical protein
VKDLTVRLRLHEHSNRSNRLATPEGLFKVIYLRQYPLLLELKEEVEERVDLALEIALGEARCSLLLLLDPSLTDVGLMSSGGPKCRDGV